MWVINMSHVMVCGAGIETYVAFIKPYLVSLRFYNTNKFENKSFNRGKLPLLNNQTMIKNTVHCCLQVCSL